ncbi:hypothetical protein CCACVL1_00844 [Corchorus capsularis]|uniref:Uncharacterized protein n=1 Tax=Corchorus capsularis TaxID=210143 RepID=A0A1R3KU43_COCAP|nr:hypothetical protein CCACVL1_00844 [Corchorus capsularis]
MVDMSPSCFWGNFEKTLVRVLYLRGPKCRRLICGGIEKPHFQEPAHNSSKTCAAFPVENMGFRGVKIVEGSVATATTAAPAPPPPTPRTPPQTS